MCRPVVMTNEVVRFRHPIENVTAGVRNAEEVELGGASPTIISLRSTPLVLNALTQRQPAPFRSRMPCSGWRSSRWQDVRRRIEHIPVADVEMGRSGKAELGRLKLEG